MFKELVIKSFRGINNLEIKDFQRINLFVGNNNCGKTTVLESLYLLTAPTNSDLIPRINAFRRYNLIDEYTWRLYFNNLVTESEIKMIGQLINPKETRELLLLPRIEAKSSNLVIKNHLAESKTTLDTKSSQTILEPKINGLILKYKGTKTKNKPLKSEIFINIDQGKSTLTPVMAEGYYEERHGKFLNQRNIFKELTVQFDQVQKLKQIPRIIKILQKIEPTIEDLFLSSDGFIYCDGVFDKPVPLNIMGDGIIRMLAVLLTISSEENGLVYIDEIENGMSYSSLDILWKAIFEASKEFNVQIFATTHSLECLQALSSNYFTVSPLIPEDFIRVYRIEKEKCQYKAVAYDMNVLNASLNQNLEVR